MGGVCCFGVAHPTHASMVYTLCVDCMFGCMFVQYARQHERNIGGERVYDA